MTVNRVRRAGPEDLPPGRILTWWAFTMLRGVVVVMLDVPAETAHARIDLPHGLLAPVGVKIGASHREAPIMPRPCPAEFRLRAVALVRVGKTITTTAAELGISTGALHNWVRQDQIDRRERPGLTTQESAELAKAKKRIQALEAEVEILKRAAKLLGEEHTGPMTGH